MRESIGFCVQPQAEGVKGRGTRGEKVEKENEMASKDSFEKI